MTKTNLRDLVFPNGFGTRALLATIVIGATVTAELVGAASENLVELATIILVFYFVQRNNGGTHNGTR